jgi:hypothetical protein
MVAGMTDTERYARQTRNATVFIAWLLGVGLAVGLLAGIVVVTRTNGGPEPTPAPPAKVLRLCDVNPTYAC